MARGMRLGPRASKVRSQRSVPAAECRTGVEKGRSPLPGIEPPNRPSPRGIPASLRRHSLARSLVQTAALVHLTERLRDGGVEALALKGPALAVLLHGDPAARPCDDVDLLVRPGDLGAAIRIVGGEGFAPGIRGAADPARGSQAPFVRGDGVVLDLHWSLAPAYDSFSLGAGECFAGSGTIEVLGRPVRILGADHHLLYLCFHGGKSLWARRLWIEDVARFLESGPAVDRARVAALAERTGSLRMLAVGVLLAAALQGARPDGPAARAAAAWTRPDAEAIRLAVLFGNALAEGRPAAADAAEETDLQVRLRERTRDRASFLLGLAFTPTPGERHRDPIGLLRPLSGGFRIARSALRHGRTVLGATA